MDNWKIENGVALRLVLKQRHKGTRKWPIDLAPPPPILTWSPIGQEQLRPQALFRLTREAMERGAGNEFGLRNGRNNVKTFALINQMTITIGNVTEKN